MMVLIMMMMVLLMKRDNPAGIEVGPTDGIYDLEKFLSFYN